MVNPVTITVRNCRRGTAAWFHEQRHVEQERRFQLLSWTGWLQHWLVIGVFVAAWYQLYYWVFWLAFSLLLDDFLLEFDAELYSLRRVGWRRWWNRSWL